MPSTQPHLASWDRRLLALVIDTALVAVVSWFLCTLLDPTGLTEESFFLMGASTFVVYQSASVLWPETSLGRMVSGIVVLSFDGNVAPSSGQAILRPMVRLALLCATYFAGTLFDLKWLVSLPLVVELALMAHTPWRRTLADRVAGTVVVKKPPLQPHRAPAYPMYSAKDEEFGPKP